VRGISKELAEEIERHRPYEQPEDLVRRVPALDLAQLEALATAGAFGCFSRDGRPLDRRAAMWAVGAVNQSRPDRLAGMVTGVEAPPLPGMDDMALSAADLWATGVSPDGHPTQFVRDELAARGVVTATGLWDLEPGSRVVVGGVVTHRQRPATAGGTTFINLEDETGLINVICSRGCWTRYRTVARTSPALLIRGRLEKAEGVINIVAEKLEPLPLGATTRSRDFR